MPVLCERNFGNMNYILYNPKANNENNDLNLIVPVEGSESVTVQKINLIGLDINEFCATLTADDRVIVCGGDGTLHHFANNVYGIEFPCPVCAIRSGTGNDFLNDLGQMSNDELIDIRPFLKDLPEVEVNGEKRKFINGVGLGIDGRVCVEAEKAKKKTNKKVSYTPIAIKLLAFDYQRPNARVTVDGVVHEYTKLWMAGTMKGRFFGGGMMVAPHQDRTNGKVSVMAMHGGSRLKTLAVFSTIFKGTHVKHTEMIEIYEGNEITVEFETPSDMQIDGEIVENVTSYTVRINAPVSSEAEKDATEALI